MIDLSIFRDENNEIIDIKRLTDAVTGAFRLIYAEKMDALEFEQFFMHKMVKNGSTCLDVGANFGLYSVLLAVLVGHEGQVLAFEPNPTTYAVLMGVLSNFLVIPTPVVSFCVALSDANGKVELALPPDDDDHRDDFNLPLGRVRLAQTDDWGERVLVHAARYDFVKAWKDKPVDFVKIDVEGAELKVLKGMTDMLKRDEPAIMLEVEERHLKHYGSHAEDVFDFMESGGFIGYHTEFSTGAGLTHCKKPVHNKNNYFFITQRRRKELGL